MQRKNLCRARHWRMLWDMLRFNVGAIEILRKGNGHTETIGAYLERNGYSTGFREDYLMVRPARLAGSSKLMVRNSLLYPQSGLRPPMRLLLTSLYRRWCAICTTITFYKPSAVRNGEPSKGAVESISIGFFPASPPRNNTSLRPSTQWHL